MTLLFILLKIIGFLAIMIIPFVGPKRKKALNQNGISALAVDENGYLEHFSGKPENHHTV
jgi:hypothetical protein